MKLHLFALHILLPLTLPLGSAEGQAVISDIRQVLDGRMTDDQEVATFERSEELYPVKLVKRGAKVRKLLPAAVQLGPFSFESDGRHVHLSDYLTEDRVSGLLILKEGKVVYESYELGLSAATRWASWSMAKSISSTLVGAALEQGLIRSLDAPVSEYVPALREGSYAAVSIRNVLRMASGVRWSEAYSDPGSDCRKLTDAQSEHLSGVSMAYMGGLKRVSPQGTVWNYNSGEANIVGAVLEGATHKALATYLSETLWRPLGMEHDATWWTESPNGLGLSGVGLGATLRDYGRFGLFVQKDGVLDGRRIVPKGWFRTSGSAQTLGGQKVDYGYQWWPVTIGDPLEQGAFQAIGIFGQHLYINPKEKLTIVVLSARHQAVSTPSIRDSDFFSAVARFLH